MADYTISIVLSGTDRASQALGNVNAQVRNLGQTAPTAARESSGLSQALSGMENAVIGAVSAWASWKLVEKIGEIKELGDKVNSASAAFTQLTGGAGGAGATLASLQLATGGVVDNLTLMEGTNRLLLMNLARTNEEAVELVGIATTLGRVMGKDAAESVGDFAALLANQSIPRLDNFGISSARVKARIDALIASGRALSREDAFTMAVLEEGRQSLERLGSAATAGVTAMDRLIARAQNFGQEFSSNVATGINALVGIGEIATGQNPIQLQQAAAVEAEAVAFAQNWQETLATELQRAGYDAGYDSDFVNEFLKAAYKRAKENPAASLDDVIAGALGTVPSGGTYFPGIETNEDLKFNLAQAFSVQLMEEQAQIEIQSRQWFISVMDGLIGTVREAPNAGRQILEKLVDMGETSGFFAEQEARKARAIAFWRGFFSDMRATVDEAEATAEGMRDRMLALFDLHQTVSELEAGVAEATAVAFQHQPGAAGGGMPTFLTQGQADAIRAQYEAARQEMERLKALADQGLIREEELTNAQRLTDELGGMADEAQRAADAFEQIRLSDVFGTGGGGMMGEISDLIIDQMRALEKTPEAIEAMRRALDLASGRETGASLFFKEQMIPMMAGMSPEVAAGVVQNWNASLGNAALMGLTPQGAALMGMAQGAGQGLLGMAQGGQFGGVGQLLGGVASLLGGGGEGGGAIGGLPVMLEQVNEKSARAAGNFQDINTATSGALSDLSGVKGLLAEMAKKQNIIRVKLDVDDGGLMALLGSVGGIAGAVRNNGGVTPGTDARVRPSRGQGNR